MLTGVSAFGAERRDLLQNASTLDGLKQHLRADKSWIKYPAYADRSGWDTFLGEYKGEVIQRGEAALPYEWKVIKATDYMEYYRSGNRSIMQQKYDDNISAIVNLFVAELAEGKGRFTEPLMDLVFSACEMTSWAISAHTTLQKTYKKFPLPDDFAVELVSSDVGAILAWIHHYLGERFAQMEPMIEKRLRNEIFRRIIHPYMENDHYWWLGFQLQPNGLLNNWTPWCNSNVLQCMLLMENDKDQLARQVYRTMVSVDNYLNFVHADGACDEGPSYWGHAGGKLYDYLTMLHQATGGAIDLFAHPMIKQMGEYISRSYVGNNQVVNFADAVARLKPDYSLIYRYGKAVNSNEMIGFAAYLRRMNGQKGLLQKGRDIWRLFETLLHEEALQQVQPAHQSPPYTWYPETQFCYLNGKEMFVAMKGGYNNESHNHNDVGTFSLWIGNEPIFIDAGVGTYTRQTFSDERYSIWTMQSQYHNLPVIDGKGQRYGKENRATNVTFNPGKSTFSLDIHTAYPELPTGASWNRTYALRGKTLTIKDRFALPNPTTPNAIHFLTRGVVTPAPGTIVVEVNGKKAQLTFDENTFSPIVEPIELTDPRLVNVWGEKIYRIRLEAKTLRNKGLYEYKITAGR